MKRSTLFLSIALAVAVCFVVIGEMNSEPANPKSERREVREQRRAERQAQMEQQIDSMVLTKAFVFRPQSIQQEPAGRMQMLTNPNFEIRIWDGSADLFMPYIKGVTPPYKRVLLNYTLPVLDEYISVQTDEGWDISFSSSLFSAATYKFKFEVNAKFGTTTLTISNIWYNDVTYMGSITGI